MNDTQKKKNEEEEEERWKPMNEENIKGDNQNVVERKKKIKGKQIFFDESPS